MNKAAIKWPKSWWEGGAAAPLVAMAVVLASLAGFIIWCE